MSGIPPNQCYICYQTYNNERIPLILTTCGHTYCKECLLLILNRETKELTCPECKQVTLLLENEINTLPKNRSLLNLIIYNEQINYSEKIKKENERSKEKVILMDKNEEKKIILGKCFDKYNEVLNKLEESYKNILNEHSYLNEISEVLIIKEIDDILDNFIDVINDHRSNLQKKIKAEFEKVNLIKNFCNSISCLRHRLNNYIKYYTEGNIINLNNIENTKDGMINIDNLPNNNIGLKFNSHKNLQNFSNFNFNQRKELNLDGNDFNKILKNKDSVMETPGNIQNNNDLSQINIININDNFNFEQQLKIQDELKNDMIIGNNDTINNCENEDFEKEECKENCKTICSNKELKRLNQIKNINFNIIDNHNDNLNDNFYIFSMKDIMDDDLQNLENEIKYSELYFLTLKSFTKEIYNPCKFFYINKFQIEKLCNDLKKILYKACDYDENIIKFKIHELNNYDEKKLIKEIQESCQQSNNQKLKFIFSHFRINPNFFYSDVLDQITNQQGPTEHSASNPLGIQMSSNLNSNNFYNLNNLSNVNQFGNHNTFSSLNIFDPISVRRNINNQNRNLTSRYNSNILNNSNAKDKIFNFFSYLKGFKDKAELNDLVRFLIDEFDYIPLKIENEGNFDLRLVREFDWKMELGVV